MSLEHLILVTLPIWILRDIVTLIQRLGTNYWIDVFPDDFAFRIHLNECATDTPCHQCVTILQSLYTSQGGRIHTRTLIPWPTGWYWTPRTAGLQDIFAIDQRWGNDIGWRITCAAANAIVEDNQITSTGPVFIDPLNVMLAEQLLIIGCSRAIGFGVAPAIENVSTLPWIASGMSSSFLCCRAMIDNVNLVHIPAGQCNLVQDWVVIDAIAMHPVTLVWVEVVRRIYEVDVE